MKSIFDHVSIKCSIVATKAYSTSFSSGISFLAPELRDPIYAIYGFVRFADEIVDSFEGYDQKVLLTKFEAETYEAIEQGISLNPILNSFQAVVNKYNVDHSLIDSFLCSMKMDLDKQIYDCNKYNEYIYGSAEVVGLMCLAVFTGGNLAEYERLKPGARRLGAAFQKVNFLRDMRADYQSLGRIYFPDVNFGQFTESEKRAIELDIAEDFAAGLEGIKALPASARGGVYLAYRYYIGLFNKIKRSTSNCVLSKRIRVSNSKKFALMLFSVVDLKLRRI